MKTKTLLVLMLIGLLMIPLAATADKLEYGHNYYRVAPPGLPAAWSPTWNPALPPPPGQWVWPLLPGGVYNDGLPPVGTVVGAGQSLLLGRENLAIAGQKKTVTIGISYTPGSGVGPLVLNQANSGFIAGGAAAGAIVRETNVAGVYTLVYLLQPQPDWEWFLIQNTGTSPVTMNAVAISDYCNQIPSLTGWGVGALVILLVGTAVWLVRRRKPVLSA